MLPAVVVDLGSDTTRGALEIVLDACNHAIAHGLCVPEGAAAEEAPRAVAIVRPSDGTMQVVRIEVRFGERGAPFVRELEFARKDPLRERWRSVGLAIATLVGEGEQRAREEEVAPEPPAPVPEPAPEPPPPVVRSEPLPEPPRRREPAPPREAEPRPAEPEPEDEAREEEEPEAEQAPAEPRVPFEHRPVFLGLGAAAGPGFGGGAWRLGGNLRAAYNAESGLQLATSLGYAWRASSETFTAEWASLDAGIGYRFALSDAASIGALLFGGVQRMRFEVEVEGVSRSEAQWNPRVGVGVDGWWRLTPGFGIWAGVEASSVGRKSRLFVAPGTDPIRASAVDALLTLGLGWWLD